MQYSLISALVIAAATFVSATPIPRGGASASQSIPIAINKNKEFAALSASSPCDPQAQPDACIGGAFAQCVGGAFVVGASCGGELGCFALPLVNRVGSSNTCTTPEDAAKRMGFASVSELNAAIGRANSSTATPASQAPTATLPTANATLPAANATLAAANATLPAANATLPAANATLAAANATLPAANATLPAANATLPTANATSPDATAAPTPAAGSIASKSIPLAIAQNKSFKGLSANSPCDAATQQACIKGNFAQCVDGAFVVGAGCGKGLECFALPLVNKVGTSVTCTTRDDAARRMMVTDKQL